MGKTLKNKLNLLILFFVASCIPLVVKLNLVDVNIEEATLIRNSLKIADVFSYSKSHLIILSSALIAIVYIIYFFTTSEKINFACVKKPIFFLPALFLFFVFLSTIFSDYKLSSFYGISERYEGMFVIISYIIFFAATINCVKTEDSLKFIFYALLTSALLIFLIGISQFYGHDFLVSSLGKKILLLGFENKQVNINPIFDTAYSTLYNPNCLGLYCAMIFPVIFAMAFFFEKKTIARYLSLICALLAIINLFASNSTGALMGIISSIIFAFAILIIHIFKNKTYLKKFLFFTLVSIILCVAAIFFTPLKNKFSNMLAKFTQDTSNIVFTDLTMTPNSAQIFYKNGKIKLEYIDNKINLYENENLLFPSATHEENNNDSQKLIYDYTSKNIDDLQVTIESEKMVTLKLKNTIFLFGLANDKLYLLSNKGNIIDINKPIEHFGFDGYERIASSRGYIWSRSFPLIKKSILIGSGPDTFVFDFPQNDIVGKLKFHASPYIIIDKPHNFYLQTIINTGLVSLLILLALFGYYFYTTIKFIMAKNKFPILQLGFASGIFGYLVSSLATDSVVSVAPVFWIILGLSFAINFFKESV